MKLEIVLPVRNKNKNLLENCLESVMRAEDGDYLLHMVDLGSTNNKEYKDIADSYGIKYSYLEYHEWSKPLLLNYALKRTDAQMFSMLDADYLIEDEFFTKIIDTIEPNTFLQCRGYEMGKDFSGADNLKTHSDFADAIIQNQLERRPINDYGGFQAIPTRTAIEIGGYDERFRLYGGMHCEMRNRLVNKGLKEKRLHGDPLLLHQYHRPWKWKTDISKEIIRRERIRHNNIINGLRDGNRVEANQKYEGLWGNL